ncbi:DUF3298 and DUF4163 domain-containing protein [Paenibacillus sp. 481]|uniref:DUF3298 and DUF4163 domain-containing protein n=1 Tax=Paenibacillus sp. 481 TaxID=2835869 RepID=UPI001E2E809F|nr:DUF3298 and DUF4163 domain-containing protein [Paenibacillus sp. 481]UHA73605.1 DUF3298 domain-containing protein [Paenibacillus sp. 481]
MLISAQLAAVSRTVPFCPNWRWIVVELYPLPIQIQPFVIRKPNLHVYVPQIVQLVDRQAQTRMNRTIYDTVIRLIRATAYESSPATTQVLGFYEVKLNERRLLSITLIIYDYPEGAAHGMTYLQGLTFDVKTGKLITLRDLFKPGVDYVTPLSQDVARQIKERQIPVIEPFHHIQPDQPFYLTAKALVLFFQLYDLAPYAYGFQYFPISIYDLNDIKAENGVIDTLWY